MSGRVLCLGDPLVDLLCERPIASVAEADAFVPRLGGTVAKIAAVAARLGAAVALGGAVGDDEWGGWLRERLATVEVDVSGLASVAGAATPVTFVRVDRSGEPVYLPVGERLAGVALINGLAAAVASSGALLLSSDSLLDSDDRAAAMGAREVALDSGVAVIFDVGLRVNRWRSTADAAASANACVPGALLVCASAWEASVLTGEEDPERAALALVKAGARLVVLTVGPSEVLLRGELRADVEPVESMLGAAEVLTGVLVGRLALSNFYPPVVAASLRDAVAAAGRA
jgi:fructokinase